MTTTDTEQPVTIPATSVEVEGLGLVTIDMIDGLRVDDLKKVLEHFRMYPPKGARKPDLIAYAKTAMTIDGMMAAGAEPRALPAPEPRTADDAADASPSVAELEVKPDSILMPPTKFQQIMAMAEVYAKSNLTPETLRGPGKVNDCATILFRAWDLGVPFGMALDTFYVVHGKVGMESKLMRAVVRRDGHTIVDNDELLPEGVGPLGLGWTGDGYRIYGRRGDNGDQHIAEFTLDDAIDYDLIKSWTAQENGRPKIDGFAREKPMWIKDPKLMLQERATSKLCRFLFPDCLAGVSYTPEELGYVETVEGTEVPFGKVGEPEPTMTINAQRNDIAKRIAALPDDLRTELAAEWRGKHLPKAVDLSPGAIRTALNLLAPYEAKAAERDPDGIPEAEEVPDQDGDTTEAAPSVPPGPDAGDETGSPGPSSVSDPPSQECAANCGSPIGPEDVVVYGNNDEAYHMDCSPFG